MGKVKITQKVADWIEKSKEVNFTDVGTLHFILNTAHTNEIDISEDVSLIDLVTAISNGYEVIREFQVGDIVKGAETGNIFEVVDKDEVTNREVRYSSVNLIPHMYVLVCKVELREDK